MLQCCSLSSSHAQASRFQAHAGWHHKELLHVIVRTITKSSDRISEGTVKHGCLQRPCNCKSSAEAVKMHCKGTTRAVTPHRRCQSTVEALQRHCRGPPEAMQRHHAGITKTPYRHCQGVVEALPRLCTGCSEAAQKGPTGAFETVCEMTCNCVQAGTTAAAKAPERQCYGISTAA